MAFKSIIGASLCLLSLNASAAIIEYQIVFTQTEFHPNFGTRSLEGTFFVDDSILGAGNENMNYGPYSSEMSALTDYTVTLGGVTVYDFDLSATQAVVSPEFSTIINTGASGELTDIHGKLTTSGTISSLHLGRDTEEGEYVDIQQTDPNSAVVVSRGTYIIERVSAVPIPSAVWLFGSGLIGLIGLARRKVSI